MTGAPSGGRPHHGDLLYACEHRVRATIVVRNGRPKEAALE